jgi:3-deoxy-manno-octulosonate cytidylyltransferase (CMP-KDO synthetase)
VKAIAVIPARMGSSRFPGKPLAPIHGRPMIQWVYEGTRKCGALSDVIVATCDEEIAEAARRFGAPVVMTSPSHERASDRVAEAARGIDADVVVMVQGDEPMVSPDMIDAAVRPFSDPGVLCTNLVSAIETEDDFTDPNTIKVVFGPSHDALSFSRAPIPSATRQGFRSGLAYRQVCIIGFRAPFLQEYTRLAPTRLEQEESVDMMRILEHGLPVRLVPVTFVSYPVDTPDDLRRVERLMEAMR